MADARSNKKQKRDREETIREQTVERLSQDKVKVAPAVTVAAATVDVSTATADASAAANTTSAPPASALPTSAPIADIFKLPCGSIPKPSRARLHALIKANFPYLVSSFINGENGGSGSIGITAAADAASIGPKRARAGSTGFSDKFFTYFFLEKARAHLSLPNTA